MVCNKGEGKADQCEGKRGKQGDVRVRKRKTHKKDIIKQYRKLIAVLPNICSKTKVSKVTPTNSFILVQAACVGHCGGVRKRSWTLLS